MGNPFKKPKPPPPPKADPVIVEARVEEEKRAENLKKEKAAYDKKVARGIIGSRSLFARAGGRGFFE